MDPYFGKARKPYVPIDTCSPGGTWIEERAYNRTRPTYKGPDASVGKVLCGNWQEERALESDLLEIEQQRQKKAEPQSEEVAGEGGLGEGVASQQRIATLVQSGWNPSATVDIIAASSEARGARYKGGMNSTPYLTCSAANPTARCLDSTYQVDYNATSSDPTLLRRPGLGVRSQALLQQSLAAAKEAQEEAERRRTQRLQEYEASEPGASRSMGPNATVYRTDYCEEGEVLPTVEELDLDYTGEEAITLYTGNPENGKTMTVHGKTPVDPTASSKFGRHTYFTERKYAL